MGAKYHQVVHACKVDGRIQVGVTYGIHIEVTLILMVEKQSWAVIDCAHVKTWVKIWEDFIWDL